MVKTWQDAETYCVAQQGHLVSFHSQEELSFLIGETNCHSGIRCNVRIIPLYITTSFKFGSVLQQKLISFFLLFPLKPTCRERRGWDSTILISKASLCTLTEQLQ